MKFALPPINSPRDAADIAVAVAKVVASGEITPNEASEFAKVIDTYTFVTKMTRLVAARLARSEEGWAHLAGSESPEGSDPPNPGLRV